MTEMCPFIVSKKVVGAMACCWAVEVVSPFGVEKFLLVVAVVGGKGGMMMMMMMVVELPTWAELIEKYCPSFS